MLTRNKANPGITSSGIRKHTTRAANKNDLKLRAMINITLTTPTAAFIVKKVLRFSCGLAVLFSCTVLNAQNHISVFATQTGDDLLEELVDAYKPIEVLNYGEARDLMYGTIYKVNDSVSCVYSGHRLYLPDGVDPSTHLYMNGDSDGINAEHTYPRSKGAAEEDGNGKGFSDMHHLFPTRAAVNSARSNFPFGDVNDDQTTSWYYLDQTQSNTPSANIDAYSERINGLFEPKEAHKGNVARAILYFFTMYKDAAIDADPDFFESQRETLLEWHQLDPVDENEWDRTYMIAAYQNDKPNPFVLDSTLAARAYCQGDPVDCGYGVDIEEPDQPQVLVYPNPVIDRLHIVSEGKSTVRVFDMLGRMVAEETFSYEIDLPFSFLIPGIYLVVVDGEVFRVVKI